MRAISKLAAPVALLALAAAPALADPPSDNPGADHRSDRPASQEKPATPGPKAGLPAKAKAYGRRCQGQSKRRSDAAEGTKGTPFSQCVTAMAKIATGETDSPRKACKQLSKKHVKGEKGTPFSRCVVQARKLREEQEDES
jgi:hypothetical protein